MNHTTPFPFEVAQEAAEAPALELRGQGLRLTTESGAELLDAVSGTFNLPLGYDHPQVIGAVRAQLDQAIHVSSRFTLARVERVKALLLEVAPPDMGAVWLRDVVGSTAVECAVKIAQKATGKTDIISLFHSHHGQTMFTAGISGNAFRREHSPSASLPHSIKVPAPDCHRCFFGAEYPSCGLRCATRIEDFIEYASSGRVAALIVEPVQGNGGNIVPPDGYFDEIRRLCDRHGMLLIVDEVQTGIGRTGQMFACQTFGIKADIIVLAKGLGGVGMPIAAVMMRPEYDILDDFEHSFTSGANLLGLAAAGETLKVVSSDGFLGNVRERGAQLAGGLRALAAGWSLISDVRGVGLMWGLEVADGSGAPSPALAARIVEVALDRHRLILRSSRYGFGAVVKVRPALVATEDDIDDILSRLAATLRDVERDEGV